MRNDREAVFEDLAAGLMVSDARIPAGIVNPMGGSVARRYAVYRNNVASGLLGALRDIFPVTLDLVGRAFFDRMALDFIRAHPPASPVLADYGRTFPAFVAAYEPAGRHGYLKDVATVERAFLDAFHAADQSPLAPEALPLDNPVQLMELRFTPHPAATLLRLSSAAATIVSRVRAGVNLSGLDPTQAEVALVTRPAFDVVISPLGPGGAEFFEALFARQTIGDAVTAALTLESNDDLAAEFSHMLASGAFAGIDEGGDA